MFTIACLNVPPAQVKRCRANFVNVLGVWVYIGKVRCPTRYPFILASLPISMSPPEKNKEWRVIISHRTAVLPTVAAPEMSHG